jgi:hypothetical protein
MRFAARLQNLPNAITPPPFRLLQIGSAFWQSRVLHVAALLGIADTLGDQTLASDEIAQRIQADPDACYRLLRMLAAMGVFEETSPRVFRNNRLSAHLRKDHPASVRDMVLMHNSPEMSRPWYEQLEQGVRSGTAPFALIHGEPLFDYMDEHPAFDAEFSRAMDSVEALVGDNFATDFDWGRFDRVIDVGGSKGSKSLAILRRHPGLRAVVMDRTQVIREAREYWQGRLDEALLARLDFVEGDALEGVPPAGSARDIYLLSAVLHGFDDDACIRILQHLARATGARGASIAVMEQVLPDSGADLSAASFDMQMFMGTTGRERTLAEWQLLFDRSGLQLQEIVALRAIGSILVLKARSG